MTARARPRRPSTAAAAESPRGRSGRWPGGRWPARLAALASGALLALAFPGPALWWLALVGLVPLLLLAAAAPHGREAALLGWLGGVGFFLAVNAFLVPKVGPFMVPLAMLLAVLWLPLGWLAWRLLGRRDGTGAGPGTARLAAALVLLPSALVVGEALRSWDRLGGPWGLLGASQWNQPRLLSVAALGGVWAVSFLLVAVNVALAAALAGGVAARDRVVAAAVAVILPLVAVGWWALRPPPPPAGTARVALVQPGVIGPVEARFRASETGSLRLAAAAGTPVDLVVWGESSIGRDPSANPGDTARLVAVARATGAPVLANVDAQRGTGGGIYKSALLVGRDGPIGSYDKMRLVPFGEYVPLRPLLGWVTRFTDAAKVDRHRGSHLTVLPAGHIGVGPLICFESAFPDLARNLAARGADLVVVQTADTTFQDSWGPAQHASLAAVRAVEAGRPVAQAAISGVSAAFDARGRRLAWQPTSWKGVAVVEVPLSRERTPYVRTGDWLPVAAGLALAAAALVELARTRGRRRSTAGPGGATLR
jgi:apolipoprotein N-acyltransferase